MAAPHVTITHDDGEVEEATLRPVAIVATERKYGAGFPEIEGTLYAAWWALHKPRGDFDTWLATVDDFDRNEKGQNGKGPVAGPLAEAPPPAE